MTQPPLPEPPVMMCDTDGKFTTPDYKKWARQYGAACRAAALEDAAAIVGRLSAGYGQARDESTEKVEYDVYRCAFKALEDARALIFAAKEKK